MGERCKKCGDCCKNIELPLGMVVDEDDIRWIEYHNIKVVKRDDKYFIRIDNQCDKLIDNKCSIYKNRPEICQLYICQK